MTGISNIARRTLHPSLVAEHEHSGAAQNPVLAETFELDDLDSDDVTGQRRRFLRSAAWPLSAKL